MRIQDEHQCADGKQVAIYPQQFSAMRHPHGTEGQRQHAGHAHQFERHIGRDHRAHRHDGPRGCRKVEPQYWETGVPVL